MWFAVDKEGLAKVAGRRGKSFIIYELLQNAWDCDGAREVSLTLDPIAGRPLARMRVVDDDPDGFKDLTHSYTLFAESEKKGKLQKRGRFNLGEKLVLALCEEAEIISTKGGVRFDHDGRHSLRRRREAGTEFTGIVRMKREELEQASSAVRLLIPPPNIRTVFNGETIAPRTPLAVAPQVFLLTETVDEEGRLHRPYNNADVSIYAPNEGEKPHLYEMGIPVMELPDDAYHVSVGQKVPLSLERDAVTPYYLREVRTAVLGVTAHLLDSAEASKQWVTNAMTAPDVSDDAVRTVVAKRFGEMAVSSDPSDHEAENRAKGSGYQVVPGGAFPSEAWEQIRRVGALKPAGQVMPTPKPFTPGAPELRLLDREEWTTGMRRYEALAMAVAAEADIGRLTVNFTEDSGWGFEAVYQRDSRRLIVNAGRVGEDFFTSRRRQSELLIHELAHQYGDHLEEKYDDGLCRIGAALAEVALRRLDVFFFEESAR